MIESTMQDFPLGIQHLFNHGRHIHADSQVITWTDDGPRERHLRPGGRSGRSAGGRPSAPTGSAPATGWARSCGTTRPHLEAYLAVPCMGAVLHTLNIRLFPEQLAYVVNHAEDQVIIVDASIAPLLAQVRDQLTTVEHIITVGSGDLDGLGDTIDYEELLAQHEPGFDYPEIDERAAAAMCYTSGTTGNPKGVAYSHRSTYLHSFGIASAQAMGFSEHDRLLL